jgi:hypothetical protein
MAAVLAVSPSATAPYFTTLKVSALKEVSFTGGRLGVKADCAKAGMVPVSKPARRRYFIFRS